MKKTKAGLRSALGGKIGENSNFNIKSGIKSRAEENLNLELAAIAEEGEDSDIEVEPEQESPEAHELQEGGYADLLEGRVDATDFEPLRSEARLWFQRGEFLRPLVRFWIDGDANLHEIGEREDTVAPIRRAIAKAITAHIAPDIALARERGGWCHIPAIRSMDRMISLAAAHCSTSREDLESQVDNKGKKVLWFGILLPSGEVVTPKALVMPASTTKRATLAGALRLASSKPELIAGEEWSDGDWRKFEHAQKQSRTRGGGLGKTRL